MLWSCFFGEEMCSEPVICEARAHHMTEFTWPVLRGHHSPLGQVLLVNRFEGQKTWNGLSYQTLPHLLPTQPSLVRGGTGS